VSILLVSFPNKTAAAAEDKLQKERIMLLMMMMMITLHHLNSETPLFLKDKSTVTAERSVTTYKEIYEVTKNNPVSFV
jgi:hypothetical protein